MNDCWKISLPVTKAEAEELNRAETPFGAFEPPPALMCSEIDPARPDDYRLDIYVQGEPPAALLTELTGLLGHPPQVPPSVEKLPDEDWVVLSQADLDPVHAGRFVVHVAADKDKLPEDKIGLQIEASQAFGTGHHPTTAGCLRAIDELGRDPKNVLDVGTGTALLALAVQKAFPAARIIASDIDPVSIDVSRENLALNMAAEGSGPGAVELVVADGLKAPALARRAPYDLILANILAGPLIDLSGAIAGALADGGTCILAGLLTDQAGDVAKAYETAGLTLTRRDPNEGWPILVMTRLS